MKTTNTKLRAAGYVRVSSKDQIDNQSLTTQRETIRQFADQADYKLIETYGDEGISGGKVENRPGLLQCLHDGQDGKFNVLIIYRLSRFGRNARELLENYEYLKQAGVELRSISEGIDFSTKYGQAFLGILAVIAQLERDILTETMLENRIARGRRGAPTSGKLPFGRTFDKETGQWGLDDRAARTIEQVAERYLKGDSLFDVAGEFQMNYSTLIKTLSERCGDTWTVQFADEKPITYDVPRLLPDAVIQQVRDRLAFNKKNNRTDIRSYTLSGFIFCEACSHTLQGQTQTVRGIEYQYYRHGYGRYNKCDAFTNVPLKQIEDAIFSTIFENFVDIPNFEKAIAESMPDEKLVQDLELAIKADEKQLKTTGKELDKLVDLALSGTLNKETIRAKEQELIQAKEGITERLEKNHNKRNNMPDVNEVRKESERIRRQLLEQFSGNARLAEMTFDEKRKLLHWLFDGEDSEGTPYGIYVTKTGRGKNQSIDYFLYGRITGLRTSRGDNIDYQEQDYLTKTITSKKLFKSYNINFKVRKKVA